jgi:hypothetical protein
MSRAKPRIDHQSTADSGETGESLPYCTTSRVRAVRQDWLIPGWLPGGCLTLLEGDKGAGKSHVAAAFAAYLCGRAALPGCRPVKPRPVIWAAAEESIGSDLRPKLAAAGCDLDLVIQLGVDSHGKQARRPTFPADAPALEALIRSSGACLVVLDPLRSYLSIGLSVGDEKANGQVAESLNDMAERTGSVILPARHLTKQQARDTLHQGTGSVAWGAVARAILRVDEMPLDGWERVLTVVRTGRDKPTSPQQYSIVPHQGSTRITWGPALDKDQALTMTSGMDEGQKLEGNVAEELIRRELAKGPRHAAEIYAAGEKERLNKSAMHRAAAKLQVVWKRKGYGADGFVEWVLPGGVSPGKSASKVKSKRKKSS